MVNKIKEGDTIDVYFEYTNGEFGVTVLSTPCATRDCWNLQRPDGTIVSVMIFSKMVRIKEKT